LLLSIKYKEDILLFVNCLNHQYIDLFAFVSETKEIMLIQHDRFYDKRMM